MRRLGRWSAAAAIVAALAAPATSPVVASAPYDGCGAAGSMVQVGVVACETLPSRALGGTTAFSYYVPPACDPDRLAARHERCPTLYLLHGFGGDLHSMLDRADHPSAWVAALS